MRVAGLCACGNPAARRELQSAITVRSAARARGSSLFSTMTTDSGRVRCGSATGDAVEMGWAPACQS